MTAVQYTVTAPAVLGTTLEDGVTEMVISAQDVAQAKEMAQAAFDADSNELWSDATVTPIAAATYFTDFEVRVTIRDTEGVEPDISVSYTGDSNDDWSAMMTGIVAALNATDEIANASYGGTRTLTAAAIADDIGDRALTVQLFAPNGANLSAGYVGTIVDEGIAGAALTAQFNDVLTIVPTIVKQYAV